MKRNINILKKVSPLAFLVLGFLIGLVSMYLYLQPRLNYQGKSIVDWVINANKNANDNTLLKQDMSTMKAQIEQQKNVPTPSPKVEYINQAPSHPNLSSCTLEGNFYFCPSDNCYYNPNGTKTGECKIPPMQ